MTSEAPLGELCYLMSEEIFCLSQRLYCIRANPDIVLSYFLFCSLQSPFFQAGLKAKATGTTVLGIRQSDLKNVLVLLPPLPTQKRIADILSKYDDLIDNNNRRIALLEESVHLLYREWFVSLRFPGHESVRVVDGVPEGWERVTAERVISFNPKTSVPKGENRPFVPMQSLSTNLMTIDDIEYRPVKGGAKFKNYDTLLARITPCLENGKTAFVQFLDDDELVATGSTELIVMRSEKVSPYWVYCLSRSYNFRQHAINSMSGSDNRQRVQPKSLEGFEILKPKENILEKFHNLSRPVFIKIHLLSDANQKLKEARDSLLPRLMNGSLEV